jgi:single-strand DNA-binding protein
MGSVNKVILLGRLGADPELSYTKDNLAICKFSLATTAYVKGEEQTQWTNIVLFDKNAKNAGEWLKKGSQVYLEGRLQTRKYEDKGGKQQYWTEVLASFMQFVDKRNEVSGDQVSTSTKQTPSTAPSTTKKEEDFDDDIPF